MISVKYFNDGRKIKKTIDNNKNIVIIGKAATSYKVGNVEYYNSKTRVKYLYGDSELTDAFNVAFDMGVKDIFLINAQRTSDYIEIVDTLVQYDFAYIVPLGIQFSDSFPNPDLKRQMTYAEFYLDILGEYNKSLILMNDYHASLYEDIDHFLNDMNTKITAFKNVAEKALQYGRNICLIANNLKDYKNSNLLAACALCTSSFDQYPEYDFGPAIFDIDEFDIGRINMAYFKNNLLKNTSIENFKNFRQENDAAKVVTIDKIIKYIEREIDFSGYKGKFYTEYLKYQLYNELGEFLRKLKGIAIRGYKINSVEFVKRNDGTGSLINDFSIIPINSIEDYNIFMEV